MTYEPQVDDYVIWKRPSGDWDEGWVYFKGDPVDNEKRNKQGWNNVSQYITIEIHVYPKKECVYTSGKPMRHKNIHCLLICNKDNWNELEYVKNRRVEEHYKELAEIQREDKKEEDKLAAMYKSQAVSYTHLTLPTTREV